MKTIKTKEPKLAPKSETSIMRENAARIQAGRANLAAQKKVEQKAKVKAAVKKYGTPLAIAAGTSLLAAGTSALSNAVMRKKGTLGPKGASAAASKPASASRRGGQGTSPYPTMTAEEKAFNKSNPRVGGLDAFYNDATGKYDLPIHSVKRKRSVSGKDPVSPYLKRKWKKP